MKWIYFTYKMKSLDIVKWWAYFLHFVKILLGLSCQSKVCDAFVLCSSFECCQSLSLSMTEF